MQLEFATAPHRRTQGQKPRGIALILVVFIIALTSILVLDLAYSTHLGARTHAAAERSLQAEYLLKSAVSFARVLIQQDLTPEDSPKDPWAVFTNGIPVPVELFGVREPNIAVALEIRPEASKIPLRQLLPVQNNNPDLRWRNVLARLFKNLGFDNDNQEDTSGLFPGRVFGAEEMVANLIDYMDSDRESYTPPDSFASGIEADIPQGRFPNRRIARVEELSLIPGFTPDRMRALSPFVHAIGSFSLGDIQVNINTAPFLVLRSLHDDIDDAAAQRIIEFRESDEGPFVHHRLREQVTTLVDEEIYEDPTSGIRFLISPQSSWFQVIAKVDYQTAVFFARAYLARADKGELPELRGITLY